jgi:hypothetical protein
VLTRDCKLLDSRDKLEQT